MDKSKQIIQTIKIIPKGFVASYGQIADLAGLPGRARLVGTVLRKSDSKLQLPWFRIVRGNGVLAMPRGSESSTEQIERLLEEGVLVKNHRVKLEDYGWKPELDELMQLDF